MRENVNILPLDSFNEVLSSMSRIKTLLFLACTLVFSLPSVQAQTAMELTITINSYDANDVLVRSNDLVICLAGNAIDAIDSSDANDDILPPVPPNSAYDVRLRNPQVAGQDAKVDCRPLPTSLNDDKEFAIVYQPGSDVTSLELIWDPEDIRSVNQLGSVVMTDAFGGFFIPGIDMADNSTFSIDNSDQGFDQDIRIMVGFDGLFLPVELLNFDANLQGNKLELIWSTATETNNSGFQVQMRDHFASDWTEVGFVEGHGSTVELQNYTFNLGNLSAGLYRFRLKQIDFDGAFEIHPEIEVQIDLPSTHSLSSAYPNPFNPSTSFSLIVREKQNVKIDLLNALGQHELNIFDGVLSAGSKSQFTIEADGLPTGVYFYRAEGEEFSTSRKVVLLR